jgi:hypothetical protein
MDYAFTTENDMHEAMHTIDHVRKSINRGPVVRH